VNSILNILKEFQRIFGYREVSRTSVTCYPECRNQREPATYDTFVHGAIFHLQHAGAMAAVINDDAVLKQANSNLSPEQKELLLWHYRLGHIGIAQVQYLLQKPRTNSFNDRHIRLISPSNNKSSHCHPPLCSSCQYAKQKQKILLRPQSLSH
jgi:hypothetical protein